MRDSGSPLQQRFGWLADSAMFVSLGALVLYTASKHEPWADEAETWVEVRDLSWFRLVTSQLRYDGHLPLWHTLVWLAMHILHLPYAYLVFLGAICAIAGLGLLVCLAPFPRPLRYVIAGSFFFLYQYAVIARPYVLLPLLGFLAAHFYRRGREGIVPFAIAIALLIQDSSYAAIIACGFSAFYAFQVAKEWARTSNNERKRALFAGALILLSALAAFVILLPKPDASLVADANHATIAQRLIRFGEGLNGAFTDVAPLTILLLLVAAVWARQRRALLLLLLAVGGVSLEYGFFYGYGHHQGLITIAFVVFLWAAWPAHEEIESMDRFSTFGQYAFLLVLLILFGWQCRWSYFSIRGEWAGTYSGAQDAANYLKSVNADRLGCAGYTFWAVGVQPYFDHNIFLNYGGPAAPARYHFSIEFEKRAGRHLTREQVLTSPPFIVFAPEVTLQEAAIAIQDFQALDYELVHYSPGTKFFKDRTSPASYFIFEKQEFIASTQAH
jgi:hypothetical protein